MALTLGTYQSKNDRRLVNYGLNYLIQIDAKHSFIIFFQRVK